ncbi:MAG TPA: EAL domain-containing protein [Steroidobacteraceae bacterium]|nr:EAL domain-containing protein [Steroidobacteraceae bacterium]
MLWLRRRDAQNINALVTHIEAASTSGTRRAMVPASGITAPLADHLRPLLDQIAAQLHLLREQDRQLLAVLEHCREPMALHGERLLFANDSFAALLGKQRGSDVQGKLLVDMVASDYASLLNNHLYRALNDEPVPDRLELELHPRTGQIAVVELTQQPIDYQGQQVLLLSMVEMTPRKTPNASKETSASRSTAWETLDSLGEAVISTNARGHVEYINRAAEQMLGVSIVDALDKPFSELVPLVDENDRRPLADPVKQCLAAGTRVTAGRRSLMLGRTGSEDRSVDVSVAPLRNAYGEQMGTVAMLRDVSELRGITRQMSYQATHDALTGLVNRHEFERHTQEAIEAAQTTKTHHMLCYLDLDRFKQVNDIAGHLAGDSLLREVASLIKSAVRDSDVVGRLGGDEFGLILKGCPMEKATHIAEDVVRKISEFHFVWKDRIFNVGVSIGLIELSVESGSLEEVLAAADSACYVAKRRGNHVHVYSAQDEAAARQRGEIHWLQRLQLALKDDQFELMAQPIVAVSAELRNNGPALEVLLRMHDDHVPEGIAPAEFLRAAERYRLMMEVDRWVVQTAFTALGRGGIRLPPGRSLAINLSGQTLGDPAFLEFVVECLDRSGVSPRQICFEVTEQSVMTNIEHARRFIGVLHGMGCRFALDDFGRGLSSFGNLKHLAIDYLKIDGSFIRNLATDTVNQAMVAAMVKLARTLNFKIIAEQVEDRYSLDAARNMGVDFVQGYELARPQPLTRVVSRAPVIAG